jgi:short-chain fatty acids transporter
MSSEDKKPLKSGLGEGGLLVRLGIALADWVEHWFPDPLVFALIAIVIVFVAGISLSSSPRDMIKNFGNGFWELIPFTMQMAMIIIGGYVVASSPPVARVIRWLAGVPRSPRGAVGLVAFFATVTSLLSWGFSLIFSALLVREVVQKIRGIDCRAASAAAFLGMGSVWALGISFSAALMMATRGSIPSELLKISGVIPLTRTIFTWQSSVTAILLVVVSVSVAYFSAPVSSAKTAETFGVSFEAPAPVPEKPRSPGEWLESNGLLTAVICTLGSAT